MSDQKKRLTFESAHIFWTNFEGRVGPYNERGERTFCVEIPTEMADELLSDGWNVKLTKPTEEGDEPVPFIQVRVRFDIRPPRVVMLTSAGRTNLNEDTVETLDWADIENVDLIIQGSEWSFNGKSGTKAYLKSLFATIAEDELERKYGVNEV